MSGNVELAVRNSPPGFTALLSSYRGTIENDFTLKIKESSQHGSDVNLRILGSYANGKAEISLDTFEGKVRLVKAGARRLSDCD